MDLGHVILMYLFGSIPVFWYCGLAETSRASARRAFLLPVAPLVAPVLAVAGLVLAVRDAFLGAHSDTSNGHCKWCGVSNKVPRGRCEQ